MMTQLFVFSYLLVGCFWTLAERSRQTDAQRGHTRANVSLCECIIIVITAQRLEYSAVQ